MVAREWITLADAARALSVSKRTLQRMIAAGDVPASMVERLNRKLVRVRAREFYYWLRVPLPGESR